jgi:hypothetical protein
MIKKIFKTESFMNCTESTRNTETGSLKFSLELFTKKSSLIDMMTHVVIKMMKSCLHYCRGSLRNH